jgi:tRNA A-37 threonylcarbamoyl transferase component Bud32
MQISEEEYINEWLTKIQSSKIHSINKIKKGINSKVYLIEHNNGSYIVKNYNGIRSGIERMERELEFLNFCHEFNLDNVPIILDHDHSMKLILQNYIKGTQEKSSENQILEILKFSINLNKFFQFTNYRLTAADNLNHTNDIKKEIENKVKFINQLPEFGFNKYTSKIVQLVDSLANNKKSMKEADFFISKYKKFILSPSDIGPHNMIKSNGKYFFIDFEYAGIDSNIKLSLDIAVHPDVQFSIHRSGEVDKSFFKSFGYSLSQIPEVLVTLFKLKWLILILIKSQKSERELLESEVNYLNMTLEEFF